MSHATLLPQWRERWRFPSLLAGMAMARQHLLDAGDLVDAILQGIAEPVAEPGQAISMLLASGEYGAARALAESGLVADRPAEELDAQIDAAIRVAEAELARRQSGLVQRARRAGLDDPPLDVGFLLEERCADAVAELDAWGAKLAAAEGGLRQRLGEKLAAAEPNRHPEWADAVQACLDAGEFPAARRLLDDGPAGDMFGGPLTVPRWASWPWPDRALAEIQRWYRGLDGTPRGFVVRWRPEAADDAAAELLEAVDGLGTDIDEDAVRRFAVALDRNLGAEERVPHQVERCGEGFRTYLAAASADYRLPWLSLPNKLQLYIGPPGWAPPDSAPAIWFVPAVGAAGASPPHGVALIDATTVFQLMAPDRKGRVTTGSYRRINLLRYICRQFRLADVLGSNVRTALNGTSGYELRDAIAWYFDLLGIHLAEGVVDALLYDTGAYPEALWAAIEQLAPDAGRPAEINAEDLTAWRQSKEAMSAFHDRVLGPILSDREVAVLLHAALLGYGQLPEAVFTIGNIESHPDVSAALSKEPVSLAAAANRVVARVLLEPRDPEIYGWSKPGLTVLLSVANDMRARLAEDISELAKRRTRSLEDANLHLQNTSLTSAMHQVKTSVFALKDILAEMTAVGHHADDVHRALAFIADLDDVWALTAPEGMQSLLARSPFDLAELLRGRRRQFHVTYKDVDVTMTPDYQEPVIVWGSRPLLKLALDNVLHNAVRAAQRREKGVRRVCLRLSVVPQEPHEPPAWAVVDVEDSGPGIPPDQLEPLRVGDSERIQSEGGGLGIIHASDHIKYNGGVLDICGEPSPDLGGAHIQIKVPLYGPPGTQQTSTAT